MKKEKYILKAQLILFNKAILALTDSKYKSSTLLFYCKDL